MPDEAAVGDRASNERMEPRELDAQNGAREKSSNC
jgi:hypothetical protein